MAVSVLPGAARELLDATEWKEYNLLLYETCSGEVVICHDAMLLQVISHGTRTTHGSVAASLNSITGAIALSNDAELRIYTVIELYGHLPQWELVLRRGSYNSESRAPITTGAAVSWINSRECVFLPTPTLCAVFSVKEGIVWCEELIDVGPGALHVHSITGSDLIVTSDSSPMVKLWSRTASTSAVQFDFTYLEHTAPVTQCWFVSQSILATVAAQTLFLWNTKLCWVIASIPLEPATLRPLILAQFPRTLLVQVASNSIWQLQTRDDSEQLSPAMERSTSLMSVAHSNSFYCTARRIYTMDADTIYIYDRDVRGMAQLGYLTGADGASGSCLCTLGDTVLAGRSLLANGRKVWSFSEEKRVIISAGASDTVLLVTEDLLITCLENGKPIWCVGLDELPLELGVSENLAILVCHSQIALLDIRSGRETFRTDVRATLASIAGSRVLLVDEEQLSLWQITSASSAVQIGRQPSEDCHFKCLKLSEALAVAILEKGDRTMLSVWDILDLSHELATFSLGDSADVSLAWSQDGDFLAVLLQHKIALYATIRLESLVKMGELNYSTSVEDELSNLEQGRTSIAWTRNLDLVLFNGQQLTFIKPALDDMDLVDRGLQTQTLHSLKELRYALNLDVPIYHPKVILEFVKALKPLHVCCVLSKLQYALKFADTSADGMSLLHPSLDLTDEDFRGYTTWSVEDLDIQLSKVKLSKLTEKDMQLLRVLAKTVGNAVQSQRLDAYALAYLALQLLDNPVERSQANVYAWFSASKTELLAETDVRNDESVAFWLDRKTLGEVVEQKAKAEFAKERDPTLVTLPYVALRKMPVLQTLWRISAGHPEREKTIKFLSNDFTVDRWRVAAHKNAYALLSKHRPEYAASFFLLGGSVSDCCQVLVSKLHKRELAVAVARLYDGDSGEAMQLLGERCLNSDPWQKFWCSWLVELDRAASLREFLKESLLDPSAAFIYVDQGGDISIETKAAWRKSFKRRGYSDFVCGLLVNSLQQRPDPPRNEEALRRKGKQGETIVKYQNSKDRSAQHSAADFDDQPLPAHLKPAPEVLQLEPDMSAFGF